jgi:hypothetical protein
VPDAVVAVAPYGPAYASLCSVHGHLAAWTDAGLAAWHAIGHATTHHG